MHTFWTWVTGEAPAQPPKAKTPHAVSVDVITWHTSKEEVGHSAFRVNLSDGSGKYYSIGPGIIPSAGPLIIFPLPAGHPSYEADCVTHGSHKVIGADDQAMTVDGPPKEPDDILRLDPARYDAKAVYTEAERRFSDPGMTYQLFPRVPTATLLMGAGWGPSAIKVMSDDPFGTPCAELEETLTAQQAAAAALHPTNCTTITEACIAAGRKPSESVVPAFTAPWGMTPSGFHAALTRPPCRQVSPHVTPPVRPVAVATAFCPAGSSGEHGSSMTSDYSMCGRQ